VGDLTLPEGLEVLDDPDTTVCTVTAPKAEAEPVPAEAAALPEAPAEPELIRKPRAGEEGEGEEQES
jgi:hypothetical protein